MTPDQQVALARRMLDVLARNTTELAPEPFVNAATTYTSAAQLDVERARLFRREPLFVGLSGDAAEPGAYFTTVADGVPIVVVRSRAGTLRAFLNVCRHRGAQVVADAGCTTGRFTCPFHGWSYAADTGRLVAQPGREGFTGLDPASLCLTSLPVAERHGMIFVRAAAADDIDVDAHLGGTQAELAAFGLERYVPFARRETERALNWKLAVDGFLEAYHVPSLHRRSLSPTILGVAGWDSFGRCGRMVVPRRSIVELRDRSETEWDLLPHCLLLYLLFPNTILIYQSDHVEVAQAYPGSGGVGTARIVFTLYTPAPVETDGARRYFESNLDLLVDTVQNEDFAMAEQIQRGLATGLQESVVYGRNEPGLVHYHREINAALARDEQRPPVETLARRRISS